MILSQGQAPTYHSQARHKRWLHCQKLTDICIITSHNAIYNANCENWSPSKTLVTLQTFAISRLSHLVLIDYFLILIIVLKRIKLCSLEGVRLLLCTRLLV